MQHSLVHNPCLVCFFFNFSLLSCRYTRQVIDETLRASILAPWGARIHEFDLQVGDFVIPKEVTSLSTVEFHFLEPPRETKIGSRNREI